MFKEQDTVTLVNARPHLGIEAGAQGTIQMVIGTSKGNVYKVAIPDANGDPMWLLTVREEELTSSP
jgi:hypothetical protein